MEYTHIGWCNEGNHDKVWGIIKVKSGQQESPYGPWGPNTFVTFWGRRGKKLQTKIWEGWHDTANEAFMKKQDKGYHSVDLDRLNEVYPEFESDLKQTAFWATLQA